MAKNLINLGTAADAGNGDPIRTAGQKINDMFNEVYAALAGLGTASVKAAGAAAGNVPLLDGGGQLPPSTLPVGTVVGRAYAELVTAANAGAVIPYDDTKPQITEGTQILTVSITPKTTTNRVRARATFYGTSNNSGTLIIALFRVGTADAIAARAIDMRAGLLALTADIDFEDVPGATTAQTYTVRVGTDAGTYVYWNSGPSGSRILGGAARCMIELTEFAA